MFGLTAEQIRFFVILIVAIGLLMTERLRKEIVAVLIIVALAITGILTPAEALAGFGSEAAIVVAAIFVLSSALHHTGLSTIIGGWIGRLAGHSYTRMIAVIMPAVALLSAFTHHLTTTAIMLPVTLNLARERDIPPSKLLMPLSFAASLGTAITIIGAPAFLLASSILQQAGRPALGIFSIAPIGLTLSAVGTLFMLLLGRILLPARTGGDDSAARFRLDAYFTEVTILPDSPFLDKTIEEVQADDRYQLQIVGMLHDGQQVHGRIRQQRLCTGDVLMVRTSPEEIVAIRQEAGLELHPIKQYGDVIPSSQANMEDIADQLVQAVVAPTSDLIDRTLGEIDFRRRYGALVISLWRKRGWMRQQLSKIKLRAGDVLVLQGDSEALSRVERDASFLMLMPFQGEARPRRKAIVAGAIMLATIVVSATNLLSLEIAALTGAVAMVLLGCITARQAYREIDGRIYVFIAGALPLGVGMEKTGASQLIASGIQGAVAGWNQIIILFILFAIVAVLTQFMSDAGTTAIFAPVAVALAHALGQAPEPYVITVAMAAVTAFLTPIGHHGNLLVYGPGNYQFSDFAKVGTPLTVLNGVAVAVLAPLIWPS